MRVSCATTANGGVGVRAHYAFGYVQREETAVTENDKPWEAFEYEGEWWVISPSRGATDGPFTESEARTRVHNLNRNRDVLTAFKKQERDEA